MRLWVPWCDYHQSSHCPCTYNGYVVESAAMRDLHVGNLVELDQEGTPVIGEVTLVNRVEPAFVMVQVPPGRGPAIRRTTTVNFPFLRRYRKR